MRKLKEAKEQHGFKPVWTTDGKIIFKEGDSLKFIIYFITYISCFFNSHLEADGGNSSFKRKSPRKFRK